jgi:hypothetical protein
VKQTLIERARESVIAQMRPQWTKNGDGTIDESIQMIRAGGWDDDPRMVKTMAEMKSKPSSRM